MVETKMDGHVVFDEDILGKRKLISVREITHGIRKEVERITTPLTNGCLLFQNWKCCTRT